jgi:hypothetical protein
VPALPPTRSSRKPAPQEDAVQPIPKVWQWVLCILAGTVVTMIAIRLLQAYALPGLLGGFAIAIATSWTGLLPYRELKDPVSRWASARWCITNALLFLVAVVIGDAVSLASVAAYVLLPMAIGFDGF